MLLHKRTRALTTGVALEYVERGPADGAPVILLHGFTDSLHSYDPIAPFLPAHLRVFAISLRGHGGSSGGQSFAFEDFADDIAAFMDAMGLPLAVLAGHSLGAGVAMALAARHPARVAGLALLAPFEDFAGHPAVDELAEAGRNLSDPIDPAFMRAFQESTLHEPIAPALLDLFVSESARMKAGVFRAIVAAMAASDLPAAAMRVRAPSIVLWGDQDAYCSREATRTLVKTLRARIVVHAGAGHALHWERPADVARDIAHFIESAAFTTAQL